MFTLNSSFSSSFEEVALEIDNIFNSMQNCGIEIDQNLHFIVQFALRELFNNAVEHGNKNDKDKLVSYNFTISKRLCEIDVIDCGDGFDITTVIKNERQDSLLRHRNRGLIALVDMGFVLRAFKNTVHARILLQRFNVKEERKSNLMKINIENKIAYLALNGGLISANIKDMVELLQRNLTPDDAYDKLVVDLSMVDNVDSMGITFLIGTYKTLSAKGKQVSLRGVSESMLNLFKIMKLEEIFTIEN